MCVSVRVCAGSFRRSGLTRGIEQRLNRVKNDGTPDSSDFTSGESDWTHTHSVSKIMEFHLVPNVPLLRIEFPGGESIRMHCGKQQAQKCGEAQG